MLIYLLTLIDNEGDRQTFTAIYQEYHVQMEKVALRILSDIMMRRMLCRMRGYR